MRYLNGKVALFDIATVSPTCSYGFKDGIVVVYGTATS